MAGGGISVDCILRVILKIHDTYAECFKNAVTILPGNFCNIIHVSVWHMPVGFCFYSFFVSKKTSVCKKCEYCLFDMGEPYGSDLYVRRKVFGTPYIFVEKEKKT